MIPRGYNNNYQILQTPGLCRDSHRDIHDVRIIPRTAVRMHPRAFGSGWAIRAVDGTMNTLVVTTTISPTKRTPGIEREPAFCRAFHARRPHHDQLRVHDRRPVVVSEAVDGAIPMRRLTARSSRYACHEGKLRQYEPPERRAPEEASK